MADGTRKPKKVSVAETKRKALELRIEGFSFRAIANELTISLRQAYKQISEGLDALNSQSIRDAVYVT